MENQSEYSHLPQPMTSAGAAWVKAYLHPPSTYGVEGIPDHSTQSTVVTNFKNEFGLSAPATTGTEKTWSALIISVPNPQFPVLALSWVGSGLPDGNLTLDEVGVMTNPNFAWGTDGQAWQQTVAQLRPVASSTTVYLDAAKLYDQGRVYCAQAGMGSEANLAHGGTTGAAITYMDLFGLLPLTGGGVSQMSSKSYSGLARDGVFSVNHFVSPSVAYNPDSVRESYFKYSYLKKDGTTDSYSALYGTDAHPTVASTYPGMSVSYTLFVGLLREASLSIKRCHSWESVPGPSSTWGPFATPGPCPDANALELGAIEAFRRPDGMPAAANDLGSFLGALKSFSPVVKTLWKAASPGLKTVISGLPGGGLINAAIGGVEKALTGKGSQNTGGQTQSVPSSGAAPPSTQKKRRKKRNLASS